MADFSFENVFIGSLKYFWSNIIFYLKAFGLYFAVVMALLFLFSALSMALAFSAYTLQDLGQSLFLFLPIIFLGVAFGIVFLLFSYFMDYVVMRLAYRKEEVKGTGLFQKLKQESHGFWSFFGWMLLFILFSFLVFGLPFIVLLGLLVFSISITSVPLILIIVLGLLAFWAFALFAFFKWFCFVPSLLVEKILRSESFGLFSAMRECSDLVKNRWWLTFGVFILFFILFFVLSLGVSVVLFLLLLPLNLIPFVGPLVGGFINQVIMNALGFFIGAVLLIFPFFLLHEYRRMDRPDPKKPK